MLNDAFLAEQAEHFARRVERLSAALARRTIELAFRLALVRRPVAAETATCRDLLDREERLFRERGLARDVAAHRALAQLCQVLFNTSEFLFAE